MDFEAFIEDCQVQWPGFSAPERLARTPHPSDRRLAPLLQQVPGFATENKLMLLNLAVRNMDASEVYVEVGVWRGLSTIGAASGNDDRPLCVCDDFSKRGGSLAAFESNLRRYAGAARVDIHCADYRAFLRDAPWQPARVGVFFYDGPHNFRHQLRALDLIQPHLADNAVVIIDDTDDLPVRAANDLFRRHVPAFEQVLDVHSPRYEHPHWWNGVQVFRWRADAASARMAVPRARYLPRLLLWSRPVVYGQRLAHYTRNAVARAAAVLS